MSCLARRMILAGVFALSMVCGAWHMSGPPLDIASMGFEPEYSSKERDLMAVAEGKSTKLKEKIGTPPACNIPLLSWFNETYGDAARIEVLDVGGGTGMMGNFVAQTVPSGAVVWDCIDKNVQIGSKNCTEFNGKTFLSYQNETKTVVLFNYVLHHAGDDTISLLTEAARVAKNYVVITEDLKGETDQELWMEYIHDAHGTFRGKGEWETLFGLLGMRVVYEASPDKNCTGNYKVPRKMWVLEHAH